MRNKTLLFALLGIAAVGAFCAGLAAGSVRISFSQLADPQMRLIFYEVRLPRVLLAFIVGSSLAVSGVIFQGLLRNPLADPYLLGSSSGGALGMVLYILVLGNVSAAPMPFVAFLFSLATLMAVYAIAERERSFSPQVLLLSGVVMSVFISACIMLLISLGRRESYLALTVMMGSLARAETRWIYFLVPYAVLGWMAGILFGKTLNLLSQGDRTARHLGVNVALVRRLLFVLGSLLVGVAVSMAGMIGFVGLIVPHIMRRIAGADHRVLIPASLLGGGIFLMIADTLARTLIAPREIPVGVVTALCGGPFFLALLLRKSGEKNKR